MSAASPAARLVRSLESSGISGTVQLLSEAARIRANPVSARASCQIQGPIIRITETQIGDNFGREYYAQVLSLWRNDPGSTDP